MFVIGLTGSLATGKSTVAAFFRKRGAKVLSADSLAHQVIGPKGECFDAVIKHFGKGILHRGKIDRRRLGKIVFNDERELKKLERIIHPAVNRRIQKELNGYQRTNKKIVLEVPLLFEAGWEKMADITVVVATTKATQLKRAIRLGMSQAEAAARIKAQMPLRKKIRRADFIIDNNGTKKQTEKQVNALCQKQ